MTTKKSNRAPSGAPATKWFISTISVVAMLGGWVGFSSQTTSEVDLTTSTAASKLVLEPIPTVVPPPTARPNAILANDPPATQPQPASQPALRSVSAPSPVRSSAPDPVTVTRSSK